MKICDPLHYLSEYKLCVLFTQLSSLSYIIEQVAARAKLHDNHVMLISLKGFQKFNIIRVSQVLQDINFIHYLLFLRFFLHKVHVDALNGN